MEETHDERFVVYVRSRRDTHDPPEDSEWPVITCFSYEEACQIRDSRIASTARDCVIRFVGLTPAAAIDSSWIRLTLGDPETASTRGSMKSFSAGRG